ncbi:MAG: Twitching mobility protein [Elusimicrobia bacterium ADurb.Bin231]|nr:MAG: Twitching mobility protein [Elusimicrobia bacterium ADurb.Bin231]
MVEAITGLLKICVEKKASDIHIKTDANPVARIDGRLETIKEYLFSAADMDKIVFSLTNKRQQEQFEKKGECDMSYSVAGIGRFRGNIYRQRGVIAVVFRYVPGDIPEFTMLNLPQAIEKIASNQRGLVLVTGTTGSGKSTTLAAMINHINSTRGDSIITIEDPIEFVHKDKLSIISQREIGTDTDSFASALKNVVRQDPDVILIGEMRDTETMAAAITAAQTGHLVFSTVHTISAVQTINRIVDMFPVHHQNQIRLQLADTLKGVISQRLLPKISGGRVPAVEILVATEYVKKCIEQNTMNEILQAMKQGAYYGMQTFDQALLNLYNSGMITIDDALSAATNPEEVMMNIRGISSDSGAMV